MESCYGQNGNRKCVLGKMYSIAGTSLISQLVRNQFLANWGKKGSLLFADHRSIHFVRFSFAKAKKIKQIKTLLLPQEQKDTIKYNGNDTLIMSTER